MCKAPWLKPANTPVHVLRRWRLDGGGR